jgi:hypothetical protein
MDGKIVSFPGAEQPPIAETDIETRHAEAFRDLENMDCVSMSKIAFDQIMRTQNRELRAGFCGRPIHGNCWKSSRRTITPRMPTRGLVDCTRRQPRRADRSESTTGSGSPRTQGG